MTNQELEDASRQAAEAFEALKSRVDGGTKSNVNPITPPTIQRDLLEVRLGKMETQIADLLNATERKNKLTDDYLGALLQQIRQIDGMITGTRSAGNVNLTRYGNNLELSSPGNDDFHLTWLTSKSVRIEAGNVWCGFEATSTPRSLVFTTSPTNLSVTPFGDYEYIVIYVAVYVRVLSTGIKEFNSQPTVAAIGHASDYICLPDVSGYGSGADTRYFPLYCLRATSGSTGAWDDYTIVHDNRYGIKFTFDVQAYVQADGNTTKFPS